MSNGASERPERLLSRAGIASRRQVARWIDAGRLASDGRILRGGERVSADSILTVDGRRLDLGRNPGCPGKLEVLIYHKPVGELVTRRDPKGRRIVFDSLPSREQGRWIAVGRLDINSEGLLLFTNDGQLAAKLMHPSSGVEREYRVRASGKLSPTQVASLLKGVRIGEREARFERLMSEGGMARNQWYRVVVREGRNRVVRRLFEAMDLKVNRLIRVRYGTVRLPAGLRRGQWQFLPEEASSRLRKQLGVR